MRAAAAVCSERRDNDGRALGKRTRDPLPDGPERKARQIPRRRRGSARRVRFCFFTEGKNPTPRSRGHRTGRFAAPARRVNR